MKSREKENLQRLDDAFCSLHAALDERKRQLQQAITQDTEEKENGLVVQEDELCFLLSQLKNCWSFIHDKLQRGVDKDVLTMKKSILERRDQLKEMKSTAVLKPVSQEQVLVSVKGIEKMICQIKSFCSVEECCIFENLKEIAPIGKKHRFTVHLKDFMGNNILNSKKLTVLVQYSKDQVTEAAAIQEISNGIYEASYICNFGGRHAVSVKIGEKPISGSPFK